MRSDPNQERLEAVAEALGPLLDELCLVGGCAAGLLITDPGASPVRPTEDVDLIVGALRYASYHKFCERIGQRGFSQPSADGAPICRWVRDDLIIDIMPLDESVLGFSNQWYKRAFETRRAISFARGSTIHVVDAPHFLATKLAAFEGRGEGDFVASPDLEDFVRVVDGRPESVAEVNASSEELRNHLALGVRALLEDRFFVEALPVYFDNEVGRDSIVVERLVRLASTG